MNWLCNWRLIRVRLNLINRISKILVERAANPLLAIDSIFAMTPTSREHDRLLKTMHDFTEKVKAPF